MGFTLSPLPHPQDPFKVAHAVQDADDFDPLGARAVEDHVPADRERVQAGLQLRAAAADARPAAPPTFATAARSGRSRLRRPADCRWPRTRGSRPGRVPFCFGGDMASTLLRGRPLGWREATALFALPFLFTSLFRRPPAHLLADWCRAMVRSGTARRPSATHSTCRAQRRRGPPGDGGQLPYGVPDMDQNARPRLLLHH